MNRIFIKIIKDKRGGATIMVTVMIMASILTVSMSLASVVINGLKVSSNQANATQAYFAAEAGVEQYLWGVRKNSFDPVSAGCVASGDYVTNDYSGCGGAATTTMANGAKYYEHYVLNTPTTTISSFGIYKDTRRAVRLKY